MACFVSYVLWGDEELSCIIKQLKSIFKAGAGHTEVFEYIDVYLQQNNDCSIILDQNQYINTINVIQISPEQSRQRHHPLFKEETTQLRGALGKLNWVAGMTRSELIFHNCEISTIIKTTTISDIIPVNKVITFIKSTPSHIKTPSLELGSVL